MFLNVECHVKQITSDVKNCDFYYLTRQDKIGKWIL